MLHKSKEDLIFILGTDEGLIRLSQAKTWYMDMTWFKSSDGILVISEKFEYIGINNRTKLKEKGRRCIPWVYAQTKKRDRTVLGVILGAIATRIYTLTGIRDPAEKIFIDFDLDNFFIIFLI